ncbi:MAG: restriction endonuclease [Deltaproteobacteria bacterium]|nr:restriction endonuclease [Deltaproteobacteria bacterium]
MKARTTRTTNRLHFTDLDPTRFEDFSLALIFSLHPWLDIRHYGRLGDDGGVDIYARERVEDEVEREWFVQCRRYKNAAKAVLTRAVDDALSKVARTPEVLLVVVACDVRRAAHEAYIQYAITKGVRTPLLWTASVLEARLHAERRDLLFTYFGISEAAEARRRGTTISRNIALKKRLRKELGKNPKEVDWEKARRRPSEKFEIPEVIVHSIDDTTYPDVDVKETGISGWFKLEVWDFYYNGLEFAIGIEYAIVDADGYWSLIEYNESYDETKYQKITVMKLARIPYRNIVDFDIEGDEYYPQPHIYCRFADGGAPYEGFRWVILNDEYPWPMNPELQFDIRKEK